MSDSNPEGVSKTLLLSANNFYDWNFGTKKWVTHQNVLNDFAGFS